MKKIKVADDFAELKRVATAEELKEINHKFLKKMSEQKQSGKKAARDGVDEMESWLRANGWPVPSKTTIAEFFERKFYLAECEQDEKNYSDPHLLLKDYKEMVDLKLTGKHPFHIAETGPLEFIREESYLSMLEMYETNLQKAGWVDRWAKGKDKEFCAAFLISLKNKKFFKKDSFKTLNEFALIRYGCKIDSVLDKMIRTKSKATLEEKTNEIIRIITGKYYGK